METPGENIISPSGGAVTAQAEEVKKRDWFKTVSLIGELLFKAAKSVVWTVVYSILWLIAAFLRGWEYVARFFKKIAPKLAAPFLRYIKAFKMNRAEIAAAKSKNGFWGAAKATFRVTKRMVFGKRGILVTAANWILPILSCIFLFKVVAYANSQTFALKLTVNGDFVGYIEDETVFTSAENMVQKRINYSGSSTEVISFSPTYEVDTIGGSTLTMYQAADKLLALVSSDIERGYGLYIGDEYFGTLTEHNNVDAALDALLDQYRTDSEKESVKFEKDITYIQGMFMKDSFVDEDDMITTLTSNKQVSTYYTVEDGDSPALIARKVDMTLDELDRLNEGGFTLQTPVYTGERIKITQDVPFLSIMITREEHYEEAIEYEIERVNDPTLYEGNFIPQNDGENGITAITANVSYVNGIEVNRTIISTVITKYPVTQVVHVGTMDRPADAGPPATVMDGQLYWPVGGYGGGKISQAPYGHGGYYYHTGLDIAAANLTPVYAAANGTVIEAVDNGIGYGSYNQGYGNIIRIRHDNGFITMYEHLSAVDSEIYVNKRVTMGELIGYVGTTGNSTGYHLHFEVRYNGVWLNPLDYLPAHAKQPGCVLY